MTQAKNYWLRICDYIFSPNEKRLLVWPSIGLVFMLISTMLLLQEVPAVYSLLLLISLFSFVVFWKASFRWGVLFTSLFSIFGLYCFLSSSVVPVLFGVTWLGTLVLGLVISLYSISESRSFFSCATDQLKTIHSDRDLWQTRFQTFKDRKELEFEEFEANRELEKVEVQKRDVQIASLRMLAGEINRKLLQAEEQLTEVNSISNQFIEPVITHSEIDEVETDEASLDNQTIFEIEGKEIDEEEVMRMLRDLNDSRTESAQLKVLLEAEREKLGNLEEVDRQRRERNEKLLGLKNRDKPISLQSLAKSLGK